MSKEFFRFHYLEDNLIRPCHHDLADTILQFQPKSVLEFGAGQGKNLDLLSSRGIKNVYGIDISPQAVALAQSQGRNVIEGDEQALALLPSSSIDVVFTCSVLCHIPPSSLDFIIHELKRISRLGLVIYETIEPKPNGSYYYQHDYESHGFIKKQGYSYFSKNRLNYNIWTWTKRQ